MRGLTLSLTLVGLLFSQSPVSAEPKEEVRAIIQKAIKAHGGEEKLAKIQAIRDKSKGTLEINGAEAAFTSESVYSLAGKLSATIQIEIMGQSIALKQVVTGDKAWISVMCQTMEAPEAAATVMKEAVYAAKFETLLPLLKEANLTLTLAKETKVDGKPAVGINVESKGHKAFTLYFDKSSDLLVKREGQTIDQATMQEVSEEAFFRSYKDINGVKWSMKSLINHDGKKYMESETTEVKFLDKVDDGEFAQP